MAGNLNYRHKRTSTANKRPLILDLQEGEIVLNNEATAPGAFLKTNTNTLVKLGPVAISASPPTLEGTGTTTYSKGELWFDTSNSVLKVYDGTAFVNSFSGVLINVQDNPPPNPSEGDLWYDDDNADIYLYVAQDTNAWVNIGPGGNSGAVATLETTAPAGPVNGQLWWDTDDLLLYVYNSGTVSWEQINSGVVTTIDAPFSAGWDGDNSNAATRNSLYDLFTGDTATITPDWDFGLGTNLDLASSAVDFNTGSILGINSGASLTAANATAVTVPTRTKVPIGGEVTNNAASQAWVYENADFGTVNGRLTTTTGTPLLPNGSNSSSTLYFTPYLGNRLWLYDTGNTRWNLYHFSEVSLALSGLTNSIPYDVYIYDNTGTLTLELVAWTDFETRATAITWQDGVPVKTGEANKRFLGMMVSENNTVTVDLGEFNEDAVERLIGLRNFYNTKEVSLRRLQSTIGQISNGCAKCSFINTVLDGTFLDQPHIIGSNSSESWNPSQLNLIIWLKSAEWGNTDPQTTLTSAYDSTDWGPKLAGMTVNYIDSRSGAYIYALKEFYIDFRNNPGTFLLIKTSY